MRTLPVRSDWRRMVQDEAEQQVGELGTGLAISKCKIGQQQLSQAESRIMEC